MDVPAYFRLIAGVDNKLFDRDVGVEMFSQEHPVDHHTEAHVGCLRVLILDMDDIPAFNVEHVVGDALLDRPEMGQNGIGPAAAC
jgi:hypothetical protein